MASWAKDLQSSSTSHYQTLHQAGWSHAKVSLLYVTSTLLLAAAYLSIDQFTFLILIIVILKLAFGYWLDQYKVVPFKL